MSYLGIDRHARQISISLRDKNGDVIEARQANITDGAQRSLRDPGEGLAIKTLCLYAQARRRR